MTCENCGAELGSATRAMRIPKGSLKALRKRRKKKDGPREGVGYGVGDVVAGRYELRAVVGEGPFGEVYDTFDRELEAEVAVKVLRAELTGEEADRTRFDEAVRRSRRLSQQNIVRLHDSGVDQDHCFVAMQRLTGLNLAKLLKLRGDDQGPYSLDELDTLMPGIVGALQHVHRTSFHGDLKPENIVVQPDRLRITDFYIRDAVEHEAFCSANEGSLYMAPELLEDEHAGDPRSDIYSLGVIVSELLSGRRFVERVELPCAYNPSLPAGVDDIILKATAVEPASRYANVELLAEALTSLRMVASLGAGLTTDVIAISPAPPEPVSEDEIMEVDDAQVEVVDDVDVNALIDPLDIPTDFNIAEGPRPLAALRAARSDEFVLDGDELEIVEEVQVREVGILATDADAPESDEKTVNTPLADIIATTELPRDDVEELDVEPDAASMDEVVEEEAAVEAAPEPVVAAPLSFVEAAVAASAPPTDPAAPAEVPEPEAAPTPDVAGSPSAGAKKKRPARSQADDAVAGIFDTGSKPGAARKDARRKKASFMRPVEARKPSDEPNVAAATRAAGKNLETERVRTLPKTTERGQAVRTTRNTALIAVVAIFAVVVVVVIAVAMKGPGGKPGPREVANFGQLGANNGEAKGEVVAPVKDEPPVAGTDTPDASAEPDAAVASADTGDTGALATAEPDTDGVASADAALTPSLADAAVAAREDAPPTEEPPAAEPKTLTPAPKEDVVAVKSADSKVDPKTDPKVDPKANAKVDPKVDPKKDPKEVVANKETPPKEVDPKVDVAAPVKKGDPSCPGGMSTIKHKSGKFEPYCIDRYEYPGGGARPATNVSWYAAESACKSQGKRLCQIQEWQRACGAKYPWGATWNPNKCVTEDADELERSVQAAGSMKTCRNGWGLYDMVGNVAEWVQEQRVVGGDATGGEKTASCYYATNKSPGSGSGLVGFRCCADASFE